MFATSDPASASDNAYAPRYSPRATFGSNADSCSGVNPPPIPLPRASNPDTLIHARDNSSATRQYSNTPNPRPPCSSGIMIPKNPTSAIAFFNVSGIVPCTGSNSFATGSTCVIANSRARSRIARRSSVRYRGESVRGCDGRCVMKAPSVVQKATSICAAKSRPYRQCCHSLCCKQRRTAEKIAIDMNATREEMWPYKDPSEVDPAGGTTGGLGKPALPLDSRPLTCHHDRVDRPKGGGADSRLGCRVVLSSPRSRCSGRGSFRVRRCGPVPRQPRGWRPRPCRRLPGGAGS
ncbi:hypothetical protein MLGJGCBP_01675 [Rhodococcus sp. T7]|nr:hypothetical protein MLGJGCBP_01675 [Rhodococcus sp. T7]